MSDSPPDLRSAAGRQMALNAVEGELVLQQCSRCNCVQYPPRELCASCLGDELVWRKQSATGQLLAQSELHNSLEDYFKNQLPWILASIQLDCGPVVLAQLENPTAESQRVQVTHQQQPGGSWILKATPDSKEAS